MRQEVLKSQLAKKMKDLDKCVARTKGLSAADKKRVRCNPQTNASRKGCGQCHHYAVRLSPTHQVRNRHASCVSRLKKKLFVHSIQTQLDQARGAIDILRESLQEQSMEIRMLQRENQVRLLRPFHGH